MKYRIIIPKIVQKQLRQLPRDIYERIVLFLIGSLKNY